MSWEKIGTEFLQEASAFVFVPFIFLIFMLVGKVSIKGLVAMNIKIADTRENLAKISLSFGSAMFGIAAFIELHQGNYRFISDAALIYIIDGLLLFLPLLYFCFRTRRFLAPRLINNIGSIGHQFAQSTIQAWSNGKLSILGDEYEKEARQSDINDYPYLLQPQEGSALAYLYVRCQINWNSLVFKLREALTSCLV